MKYNTLFDVAFAVVHEGDPSDVPVEVLLNAMQKRIDFLKANPAEALDAFGINDSYEIDE